MNLCITRREAVAGLAALGALAATGSLTSCQSGESSGHKTPTDSSNGSLTWGPSNSYTAFLDLVGETYPEIKLGLSTYAGGNTTGYTWSQMRADDIPDVFTSSVVVDPKLASERLIDLSNYDFISKFSTAMLDEASYEGGVYLVPVSNIMYGIFYNKTLMEEHGWEVPQNFEELEALCAEIRKAGLIPGIAGTELTGSVFSEVFNLAKTDWLTTPEGAKWERDFLAGNATAAGVWENTMDYVQKYIDIGMYTVDPDDGSNGDLLEEYLGERKAVFFTAAATTKSTTLSNGDELGLMPYIGEDGSRNIYMYNPVSYVGLSKTLADPGNEKKLEEALDVLSLLFSPDGQACFASEDMPCVVSILSGATEPEGSFLYDAQKAMGEGRAVLMTYANWEDVLADMGQAYKDWFRGKEGADGASAIAQMDALKAAALASDASVYFAESSADFSLEQTAALVAQSLREAAQADAALMPYVAESYAPVAEAGNRLTEGETGKLYAGPVNADVAAILAPLTNGTCMVLSMSASDVLTLADGGFTQEEAIFPYVLVTADGKLPEGEDIVRVALMEGCYGEGTPGAEGAQDTGVVIREAIRAYFDNHPTVSPDDVSAE